MRIVPKDRQMVKVDQQFGKLTVIGEPFYVRRSVQMVVCLCQCGTVTAIESVVLLSGRQLACGCLNRLHGMKNTPIYLVWQNMKGRCYDQSDIAFDNYGGRGITVCEEWRESFIAFRDWALTHGYSPELQIDRIENDGHYTPENCRFVTPTINGNNKRNNIRIECFGEVKTLSEWSRDSRCQVSYATLYARIVHLEWPLSLSLCAPPHAHRKSKNRAMP